MNYYLDLNIVLDKIYLMYIKIIIFIFIRIYFQMKVLKI